MSILLSFVLATATLSGQPKSYRDCAALVAEDPERGLSYAEQWGSLGGQDEALHCRAMALIALDSPARAATILETLAANSKIANADDPGVTARLFAQAAEAWMASGDRTRSFAALREAYELTPDAADLHMTSATVYATGEQWEGVTLALTALERHAALSADALALRGRAFLHLQQPDKAAEDASAALRLDPLLVDALVLRGDILTKEAARADSSYQPK